MARRLTNLKIEEVSSVDRGAGRGVKVVLFKRDADKRDFSSGERQRAADSGAALPDGSFPIKTKEDLRNAIQAIGRAKNPARAKAHIKTRARALGATDMLPESWSKKDAAVEKALEKAISACGGKTDNLVECFKQFHAYLIGAEEKDMEITQESLDKAIAEGVAKQMDEYHKMTVRHGSYAQNLDGDEQKRFQSMGMGDREKYMKDNPIPGEDGGADHDEGDEPDHSGGSQQGAEGKPAGGKPARSGRRSANKRDNEGEDTVNKAIVAENEMLKKRVIALEEKDQRTEFSKRAVTLGLAEADGEMLLKAHRGDPKALEWMEGKIKALQTQVEKSGMFSEIGSGGSGAKTAYDELVAKGEELRRASGGKLTAAQAFEKAMSENPDLAKREKDERYDRINKMKV